MILTLIGTVHPHSHV